MADWKHSYNILRNYTLAQQHTVAVLTAASPH